MPSSRHQELWLHPHEQAYPQELVKDAKKSNVLRLSEHREALFPGVHPQKEQLRGTLGVLPVQPEQIVGRQKGQNHKEGQKH